MLFVVILILILSAYCAIFKPPFFILIYGVFGCAFDSRGFTGYFSSIFSPYTEIMNALLFLCMFISAIHYLKTHSKPSKIFLLCLLFVLLIDISFLLGLLIYGWETNLIYGLINGVCSFGPAVFIVWYSYLDDYKQHKKLFTGFVLVQILIAFLIIYLPTIGIDMLSVFDGSNYFSRGDLYQNPNRLAHLNNFFMIFTQKGYFLRCGQFHNANPLGLYAGIALFLILSGGITIKKKPLKYIVSFLLVVACILLWSNSGMRGVIYAILFASALIFINRRSFSAKAVVSFFFVMIAILISFLFVDYSAIFSYLFGENSSGSIETRTLFLKNGIEYAVNHIFIGNGGLLEELTAIGIDPHQLPLRLWIMYGLPVAVVSTFIIFILPLKEILLRKKKSFYSVGLLMIVWFTALTNNYTSIVVFWLCLAEALCAAAEKEGEKNDDKQLQIGTVPTFY